MSSEALREAKVWLEQLASADRELVRTSGLAAALLAEVARLERAGEHAEQQRAEYAKAWVDQQFRLQEAEAALAVAREREQHLRDALNEAVFLLDHLTVEDISARSRRAILVAIKFARAALVDEPAADEPAPGENDQWCGDDRPHDPHPWSDVFCTGVPPFARAAADEPGETP